MEPVDRRTEHSHNQVDGITVCAMVFANLPTGRIFKKFYRVAIAQPEEVQVEPKDPQKNRVVAGDQDIH